MHPAAGGVAVVWQGYLGSRELRSFCLPELKEHYWRATGGRQLLAGPTLAEGYDVLCVLVRPFPDDGEGANENSESFSAASSEFLRHVSTAARLCLLRPVAFVVTHVVSEASWTSGCADVEVKTRKRASRQENVGRDRPAVLLATPDPTLPRQDLSAGRHRASKLVERLASERAAEEKPGGAGAHPSDAWVGVTLPAAREPRALPRRLVLGRHLQSRQSSCDISAEAGRAYKGGWFTDTAPTGMGLVLALLTGTFARVKAGSVALDPCAGSGSLLRACAELVRGGGVRLLGCDVDARWAGGERALADARQLCMRPSCLDAVVVDPPYGVRAAQRRGDALAPETRGDANRHEFLKNLCSSICSLAGNSLVTSGRLVLWVPLEAWGPKESMEDCFSRLARQSNLRLVHCMPESHAKGLQRALVVMEKPDPHHGKDASCTTASALFQAHPWNAPREGACRSAAPSSRSEPHARSRHLMGTSAGDVWRAAWLGDLGGLEAHLAAGFSAAPRDARGLTPLHFAAGYGRLACAEALLAAGAPTQVLGGKDGAAPLHRAAARGHAGVVRALLRAGASRELRNARGQTAALLAAQFGHAEALAALIAGPAENLPVWTGLREHDAEGLDALSAAARWGKADCVRAVLSVARGQQVLWAPPPARSPASHASQWGHVSVLRALHEAGVPLDADADALAQARVWNRAECVEFLERLQNTAGVEQCGRE